MSSENERRLSSLVLKHLGEMGAGRSTLDDEAIALEPDEAAREILMALLLLHEDLGLEREERRRASEEREQLLAERALAIQARDEFLSIGAHELRTPLTSLRLQVEFTARVAAKLGADSPIHAELVGRLAVLRRQISRLELLVSEMLDVSRLNTGRLELHPEPLDVVSVVREILERLEPEIERHAIEVQLAGDAEVPAHMDRLRLEAIITNLVSNALRYGERKPVKIAIHGRDHSVEFSVSDSGCGISAEEQERLFQPFSRLIGNRTIGGLGLGLWIVRNLVTAMGGEIKLASEVGRGSCFSASLPRG